MPVRTKRVSAVEPPPPISTRFCGQTIAMNMSNAIYYLLADFLNSSDVVLNSDGTLKAAQLFAPYGTVRYSQGTMPTTHNFTGQRKGSQTGLLYYNARYYDPVSGRFTRADTVQNNTGGMDPYGYVGGNPETRNDPTEHCWPLCTIITGAIVGVVAGEVAGLITGKQPSWQTLAGDAVVGAVLATIAVAVLPAAAAAGAGVWSAAASAAIVSGSSWGAVIGTSLALGVISGVGAGIAQDITDRADNIFHPPPVQAPGPTMTPTPNSGLSFPRQPDIQHLWKNSVGTRQRAATPKTITHRANWRTTSNANIFAVYQRTVQAAGNHWIVPTMTPWRTRIS